MEINFVKRFDDSTIDNPKTLKNSFLKILKNAFVPKQFINDIKITCVTFVFANPDFLG